MTNKYPSFLLRVLRAGGTRVQGLGVPGPGNGYTHRVIRAGWTRVQGLGEPAAHVGGTAGRYVPSSASALKWTVHRRLDTESLTKPRETQNSTKNQ